jgi:hypothetical protein
MKRVFIYVNWEERDIKLSYSFPGSEYEKEFFQGKKQGPLAKKYLANGYCYYGSFHAFDASELTKIGIQWKK